MNKGAEAYNRGDYGEALKQWLPYAKEGNYYAQYNIAIIWEQGLGNTPLNPEQAMAWYMLSAKQGYFPAMVRLASLQRSKGYDIAAESWLVLAARWGHQDAVNALREWGKEVPAADLLAQQQYNNAVANQKIIDAVLLSFIAVLNGAVEYHNATHYQSPPVSYRPTVPIPSTTVQKPSVNLPQPTYTKTTTQEDNGCSSDYSCGIGYKCVKAPFKSSGVCMKSVNDYGTPVYNTPRSDSIGIKTEGQCMFNTDCPIGFKCDQTYKACVK